MDEISRELPIDTTTGGSGNAASGAAAKGPAELVAFERGVVEEQLVVRDRIAPPEPAAEDGLTLSLIHI